MEVLNKKYVQKTVFNPYCFVEEGITELKGLWAELLIVARVCYVNSLWNVLAKL